ncbi:MAG: ion channel, partial [bacterium]|nr:ion channel [bacterium]
MMHYAVSDKNKLLLKDIVKIVDGMLLIFSSILLFLQLSNIFTEVRHPGIFNNLYLFLWVAFLFEFVAKFIIAKNKWKFLKDDIFVFLIIVFPFMRPFRLFSLSRLEMLIIAEQANDRFPFIRKIKLLEILLFSIVLVVLSADLFLEFEKTSDTLFKNFGDAVWFSVVTVATVGYGDIYPKTQNGRLLASFLIIFGISIFGIVT